MFDPLIITFHKFGCCTILYNVVVTVNTLCYGESTHFDLNYLDGSRSTLATLAYLDGSKTTIGHIDGSRTTFNT
jgi:hypothetical protein